MTNNKRKRQEDSTVTKSVVAAAAVERAIVSDGQPKLTKQQKRDAKRNGQSAQTSGSAIAAIQQEQATENVNRTSQVPSTVVPASVDDSAPVKLTKQQKRDAKRASDKVAENVKTPTQNSNTTDSALQSSILKASVYKRIPVLPSPSPFPTLKIDRFLTPKDKHFQKVLGTCYDGFVLDKPEVHPNEFHTMFESSFLELEKSGVFQFDLTQPAGLGTKVQYSNKHFFFFVFSLLYFLFFLLFMLSTFFISSIIFFTSLTFLLII